jgi:hypothetical protein
MKLNLSPIARVSCSEAVAWRLEELEREQLEADRRRARRTSLDLLHCALASDEELDRIQALRLHALLCDRERYLHSRPLPVWPGAEHALLNEMAIEVAGNREAVDQLEQLLAAA